MLGGARACADLPCHQVPSFSLADKSSSFFKVDKFDPEHSEA